MRLSLCLSVWLGMWPTLASGRPTPVHCARARDGSILVDGIFTDWQGSTPSYLTGRSHIVAGSTSGWSGSTDLSAEVHCGYTTKALFFLVKVTDEYVVRSPKLTPNQDHIAIHFRDGTGVKTLVFFPSDGRQKAAYGWLKKTRKRRRRRYTVNPQAGITAAVIRLPNGYALELQMANASVPGYGAGSPAINLSVQMVDVDSRARQSVESVMGTGGDTASRLGRVDFQGAKTLLNRFLSDRRLTSSAVKLHKVANFVTGKALERLVIANRYLAVMGGNVSGGGYYYLTLPVRKPSDVLRFAIRDMDGDGQPEVLIRLRQTAGNKARELYLIYRYLDTGGFGIIFGKEIVHKMGPRLLTNKYRYIKKRIGWQMEFFVDKCIGWTRANHQAVAPKNILGIITPWSENKKVRYKFTSEGYEETD